MTRSTFLGSIFELKYIIKAEKPYIQSSRHLFEAWETVKINGMVRRVSILIVSLPNVKQRENKIF